jgi:ubiquinone/menaquinone biosynthesis C-methylase UbiE
MDKSQFAVDTYNKIAEIYTDKYFNDLADIPYIDKFLSKLRPKAKILDIGCGPGTFSKYLVEQKFIVKGVDLSEQMIQIAKKKVERATFKTMDMRNLQYDEGVFEGLLVAYSLIHIPSSEIPKTMKGFFRVLKRSGYMMIIAQGGKPDQVVDEPLMAGEKIFINFFTKQRLARFIIDAGFEVVYQKETPMKDADSLSDRVIYTIAKKP